MPVVVPSGAQVALAGAELRVKGPKGELSVPLPEGIQVEMGEGEIRLSRSDETKRQRSLHGLARSLVANAVTGVTEGFSKKLEIHGVGYRSELKGRELHFTLGYSHPVVYPIPEGIDVQVTERNTRIEVSGFDRQKVGQVAAELRSLRKPDAYKGKGIRYAGEQVRLKAGKSGVK
jgi:large subunit ribosomal protein L6